MPSSAQEPPAAKPTPAVQRTRTRNLPSRDYLLLPLLSLLTVVVMFALSEVSARLIFASDERDSCLVVDPYTGPRSRPNCVERIKSPESPWITDHYNNCGYRSPTPCGVKPPGSVRVVLMGSSFSYGLYVPMKQTFAVKTSADLTRVCHRPVEFQNLGHAGSIFLYVDRRMKEAASLHPDLVLLAVTPFDLEGGINHEQIENRNRPEPINRPPSSPPAKKESLYRRAHNWLTESRSVVAAQHFLFQNRDTFIRLYMMYGDKADFLRNPTTPAWQQRYADLDLLVGEMADQLQAAHISFALMAIPSRIEAALLSSSQIPAGVDPYAFDRTIARIAAQHGAAYLDIMSAFSKTPDAENLFYVVDGHPTAQGQTVIANALSNRLLGGVIPALSGCSAANLRPQGAVTVSRLDPGRAPANSLSRY